MVFKTIIENIRSFIYHEEELLHDPKPVPDTASEVLGMPAKSEKIVAQSLPSDLSSNISSQDSSVQEKKPLISADRLRAALAKHSVKTSQPTEEQTGVQTASQLHSQTTTSTVVPDVAYGAVHEERTVSPVNSHSTEGVLDADVRAFEEAMSQMPAESSPLVQESAQTPPLSTSASPTSPICSTNPIEIPRTQLANPLQTREPLEPGFFASFEEFLTEDGISTKHFDGDLLHKMRSFHERQSLGQEPFLHKSSATEALHRRLQELQSLEHEWHHAFVSAKEVERSMIHIEEEIDEKTQALKTLLTESEHLTLLAKETSAEQAFVLADGSSVRSLGSLIRVLHTNPWLYDRHVSVKRNDFALWAEDVFGDKNLASRLKNAKTLQEFVDALQK